MKPTLPLTESCKWRLVEETTCARYLDDGKGREGISFPAAQGAACVTFWRKHKRASQTTPPPDSGGKLAFCSVQRAVLVDTSTWECVHFFPALSYSLPTYTTSGQGSR